MKLPRSFLKTILFLILIFILALSGGIVFLMVTEYRPEPVESAIITPPQKEQSPPPSPATGFNITPNKPLTCLTWNIGYAGLSREQDFFYDGGTMVQPSREESQQALEGIREILTGYDSLDFLLLQEVDFDSKRSGFRDQSQILASRLGSHATVSAQNYRCRFIPVPVFEPMGKVTSGLVTFSKGVPWEATRHACQSSFPWPKRLVFLKRCFLVTRFPFGEGKELVLVNLHNSTFDANGSLRMAELKQLKEFLNSEYRQGHFIVVGGDWNLNPEGFAADSVITGDRVQEVLPPVKNYLPGWTFAFDNRIPTNRNVDQPYRKGRTGTTIIDFFLLSPNLCVRSVRTMNLEFAYSDHNPVLLTFEIR